ncbi:neprilysin-2-like [Belonocnema kinseyi]|uniref:neprilysin-2-like n=1 Tax=Belonocnema kinseyi TaxID=2817044 RepID=UPI00143D1445|nr:neprilysin-2-like [Belonocnema kinseyi]
MVYTRDNASAATLSTPGRCSIEVVNCDLYDSCLCCCSAAFSELCKKAYTSANAIRQSIDPKVAPCNDFYAFACGNFLKTAVVSKDNMSVDRYSILQPKMEKQLRGVIDGPVQNNEPRHITLSKNFYQACLKSSVNKKNSRQEFLSILKNLGGLPMLEGDSWKETTFDWIQTSLGMVTQGLMIDGFFTFDIVTDFKDSTKNVLDIDQPMMFLDREAFIKGFKDKTVSDYFNTMVNTAVKYGANKARAQKELRDVLDFEISLASITISEAQRSNPAALENLMTLKVLTKTYPYVPWKKYFNTILKSAFVIGDDEIIKVSVPSFFAKLGPLLKKTSKRVLANYLIWKVLEIQMQGSFSKQECLDMTTGFLGLSAGAQYASKYFSSKAKKSAEEIAVNIEQQFSKMLKKSIE